MKKKICNTVEMLLFCITLSLLFAGNSASAKKIAIDKKNFSQDMISYVVNDEHDKNEDGYLSDNELKSIDSIELQKCDKNWPFDFKGIEKLKYLKKMNCGGINFKNFNYDILKKIKVLQLYECELDYLDFEKMPLLEELEISSVDARTTYNLKKNTKLRKLLISDCKVKSLDISHLKNLEKLTIGTGIPRCDISKNKKLKYFELYSEWDKLELSKNKALKEVIIKNTKIKLFDLRSQKKLETLEVEAKNCKKILMPYAKKMKSLTINAPIKSFDCSKIPNIEELKIAASINKIEFENNVKLDSLYIDAPVDTLDIGKLPALEYLTLVNATIGVFNSAHPTLHYICIEKCDVTELDISNLPILRNVIVSNTNLNNFIASENNALLEDIEFSKCKELMKVEIKDINEMEVVSYIYKGDKGAVGIKKDIEEVWDSQTGQIDIMEKQTHLNIYRPLVR